MPRTWRATTPSWLAKCFPRGSTAENRLSFSAGTTRGWFPSLALVVPADRVALDAIRRSPAVRHFIANLPELREKLVAHALFQDLHRAAFERLRFESDGAMNELHVLET